MSLTVFRRSQLAPEGIGSVGLAVAATKQLSGALSLTNQPQRERRIERRATMGGSNVWTDYAYRCAGTYAGRAVTNELPYILSMAVRGDITTPTANVWTFDQPIKTVPALRSCTLYAGDNSQAFRAAGCYVEEFTLEAQDTGAVMLNATILGHELVKTGVVFDTTLTTMPGDTAKNLLTTIAIADGSGTIGSPVIAGQVYGFRLTWNSGIAPDYTMDMQLDMTDIQRDEPECTVVVTAKLHNAAVNEFDKYRLLSNRYVRLLNIGQFLSGTSGPRHTIQIDGCYVITDFTPLAEERDGTTRCTFTMTAVEDPAWGTDGTKMKFAVTNTLASL
jgi:hypothetical protein